MQWAAGGDPCEYLASRKKSLSKPLRDRHVQTAGEYVAVVQQTMEKLVNECNAFETGPIFAELRVQLADLRKDNIYGKAASKYVMHSQYVEHLVNKGPVDVKTARILSQAFSREWKAGICLADDTTSIDSPAQGDAMGFEYKIEVRP
jgi:hypothetical protein